ncbi:MAG: integrase [Proteobacteria bacterium]|nr:integrase [Pseudomonadota bacterium]NOG58858.1 integrase [Pseudomonadota bacterium]
MSRGRKRKLNPTIPAHIEQDKLPNYCYWDSKKKHWYTKSPYTLNGAIRERVAGNTAMLSELHQLMEMRSGIESGTFNWLSSLYKESKPFQKLAQKTKKNYCGSEKIIKLHKTKRSGLLLGQTLIRQWDDKMLQRFIDQVEISNGPTAANECLKYIRIITKWGDKRDHCSSLGLTVDKAKERKLRRLPDTDILKNLIDFAWERGQRKTKTEGSCPSYLWCAFIIGYELRARGIETNQLTDADISDIGLKNERVKGSNTNITKWSDGLIQTIKFLTERRQKIWDKKKYPIPAKKSERYLFVTETGSPLKRASLTTAYNRLIQLAIKEGIMTKGDRFGLHDLKRRGITDTKGTRAEKMQGSGHKSENMMDVYDFSVPIVNPVSE